MSDDLNIILTEARNVLKSFTDTLQKDVRHCIFYEKSTPDWPAPFPALIYCFSMIDLVASLYSRNKSEEESRIEENAIYNIDKLEIDDEMKKKAKEGIRYQVSANARRYMVEIMSYPKLQSELLLKIFRNPLVHQAQPKSIITHDNNKYTWKYFHKNRTEHLKIVPLTDGISLFNICIWSLAEDIVDSVFKPNGYLNKLENEDNLQKNFNKKIKEYGWI